MRPLIQTLAVLVLAGCPGPDDRKRAPQDEPSSTGFDCSDQAYPHRQLRLLTRAQYDATVCDLLPQLGADDCAATQRYTGDLPPETRPQHFPFTGAAETGLVTALHAERFLDAGAAVAADALAVRDAILGCAADQDETDCAHAWIAQFGRRAFRRPLTADEVTRYAALLDGSVDLDTGFAATLEAFLSSPHFLYRSEVGTPAEDGTYTLTPHEIATALSYTLWGTTPDDALLAAADRGDLDTPEGIEVEARRLLADDRARALVGQFVHEWLGLDGLAFASRADPAWTPALVQAIGDETRAFSAHVVFDGDQTFDELLTARFTFANEALGALYNLEVEGDALRRIDLPGTRRAGLLGHASVLASTAHASQTSPILRGLLVRERLLCTTFPPPPPGAGVVPDLDPSLSTIERYAQHSADPSCAGCHDHIDPIGFGLEHFDPIGRWRDMDGAFEIPDVGWVTDIEGLGSGVDVPFSSIPELATALAESPAARRCFVTQWYRFTFGELEPDGPSCAIDLAEDRFLQSETAVQELLVALTQTPAFTRRLE